jgi:DNA-directed RNA polymerase subunit beta
LNDDGTFIRPVVKCRQDADFPVVPPTQVDLMDVSPQQIASIAASLIPFLEHDDAHRALMGSNMMRQAVPLLHNEAPIVGTGIEKQVCEDSRTMITAEGDGVVDYVDATTIRILYDRTEDEEFVSFEPALKEYRIPKFRRTNQNMTIDLRPICDKGQRVKKGDILTEGYATENGELALGRNLLVAYMPWKGYNYEDAIVLNERIVREDVLTSVHVDEYSLDVREPSVVQRSLLQISPTLVRRLLRTSTTTVLSESVLVSSLVISLLVRFHRRVKVIPHQKRSCCVPSLVTRLVM